VLRISEPTRLRTNAMERPISCQRDQLRGFEWEVSIRRWLGFQTTPLCQCVRVSENGSATT
jgi:hypothetical protein